MVVRPLNSNRWNLNIEAILSFQKQQNALVPIYMSEHRWQDAQTAEEEAFMILGQGDESSIAVPAVFMFVRGMPVVVDRNTPQGLKLVNGQLRGIGRHPRKGACSLSNRCRHYSAFWAARRNPAGVGDDDRLPLRRNAA